MMWPGRKHCQDTRFGKKSLAAYTPSQCAVEARVEGRLLLLVYKLLSACLCQPAPLGLAPLSLSLQSTRLKYSTVTAQLSQSNFILALHRCRICIHCKSEIYIIVARVEPLVLLATKHINSRKGVSHHQHHAHCMSADPGVLVTGARLPSILRFASCRSSRVTFSEFLRMSGVN